jgi:hypothetical protein
LSRASRCFGACAEAIFFLRSTGAAGFSMSWVGIEAVDGSATVRFTFSGPFAFRS